MTINDKSVGLALSGGGYRATLFGLGSLWRLNEAGLLGRIDRITGVSGGAILLGVLAHRWRDLQFADGRASNFAEAIGKPVRDFCATTIDVGAGLAGLITPFRNAGDFLASRYAEDLFGATTLKQLPAAGTGCPRFVFYATNMQTGRSFRFRQDFVADYLLGLNRSIEIPLAVAVAASSAFPPLFSPVVLKTAPGAWSEGGELPDLDALRRRVVLADGGVYDNMGLETLVDNVDIVLVSDAGAPFSIEESPAEDKVFLLGRVRDMLIDQTRALRKRWLIEGFEAGSRRGAYWGIGTRIEAYPAGPRLCSDTPGSAELEHVPTRLRAFDGALQGRLINWGYALCDVALRTRASLPIPAAVDWPVPEAAL